MSRVAELLDRWLFLALMFSLAGSNTARATDELDFNRDIRPILSENCFQCHGPDAKARQAELRLDTRDGATQLVDGRAAIKPGHAAGSEVMARIHSTDPDLIMPPPKTNRRLSDSQKATLERWIAAGAPYAVHWAFVPPQRPRVPMVDPSVGTTRNPLDAFLLQRLAHERLSAAPEADRRHLIRRVTLDLTGLPPTPLEIDEFLADDSPQAYDRLVDRLFSSPRYGERMVWDWLDAARYADTNGYQGDPTRSMWYWRDWAVAALNANQPFDRFTVEQLAGDLLSQPTQDQLIATGFHRNHMINGEGGRIAEESRVDYVQDRVETTGMVWLGLTLNCCRCHDHKFDPIAQKEYYRLAAYFNSIEESGGNDAGGLANPVMNLATPEQQAQLADLRSAESAAGKLRDETEKRVKADQPAWEAALVGNKPSDQPVEIRWQPLLPSELSSQKGAELKHIGDGVVVASGTNPNRETYTLLFPAPLLQPCTGLKLEALPDSSLTNGGPGRADNGNFVLSELIVEVYGARQDIEPLRADYFQDGWPPANAADGKNDTGWAVAGEFGRPHELIAAFKNPVTAPPERPLVVRLAFQSAHPQHALGKFRLFATADRSELLRGLPDNVRAALAKPEADRSDDEKKQVSKQFLDTHEEVLAARDAANKARTTREGFERSLPRTMVMRERKDPRETFTLVKGAYDKPADKVTHGTPAVLPALPADAPTNRLALAEWLMRPDHPLTARVVVNRMWLTFLGTGLVKTAEDFGSQGEEPSHPELLDWLAREFIDSGWDVKHLQRLIVTCAAYRQSSKVTPELVERDPDNRLLARGPRYRWPSWMLRDQALAAAGVLVETIGGPPVKGYQPPGIWEEATFGQIRYQPDKGPALHRRSVYQFWRRIVAPTMFFDIASRQQCTVKVARTNTPLHALTMLNDVTYAEAARVLAERVIAASGDDAGRLSNVYRRCLGRAPTDTERNRLLARLARLRDAFTADPKAADALIHAGEWATPPEIPAPELAAWTSLCTIVLNLDEMLSKE